MSVGLVVGNPVLEYVEGLEAVFRQAFGVLRSGREGFACELHPFRQITGGQAQFTDPETGESMYVSAFGHDVSDYVNAALGAGFYLVRTDDWRDRPDAPRTEVPRLFRCGAVVSPDALRSHGSPSMSTPRKAWHFLPCGPPRTSGTGGVRQY